MLDHFKALFAVAGGVAGVSGGAVTLTLRQSSLGGGNPILASASIAEITPLSPVSEDTVTQASESEEQSPVSVAEPAQDTQRDEQPTSVEPTKEEKDNCKVVDFPNLGDVFFELIGKNTYVLISCTEANKGPDAELPNKWTGLFPSDLFTNKNIGTKFKLTAEITGTSQDGTVTFSSEILSPSSITGKRNGVWRDPVNNTDLLIQEIDLQTPQSGKIFLVPVENVEFFKKS